VQIPIACTLSADTARTQLREWSDLLATAAVAGRRTSPTEVIFELAEQMDHLPELVALARREKQCCTFFRFTLEIEPDAVELRISVPAEASAALDGFQDLIAH
jgi:hypothetical protein